MGDRLHQYANAVSKQQMSRGTYREVSYEVTGSCLHLSGVKVKEVSG